MGQGAMLMSTVARECCSLELRHHYAVRCPLYAVNLADTREYVLLTYVFPKAKLSLSLDSKAWRGGATLIGHDLYKALEWRRQFPLVSSYSDSGLGPEMVIG